MRKFIQEYGRLVIAIIALTGFFAMISVLLSKSVSGTRSIYDIFKKNSQSSSAVYNEEFYEDTVEDSTAPYFKISEDAVYEITENQIDWDRLFRDVRIYYKDNDITELDEINGQTVQKTVLIYEYKPSIATAEGTDANGYMETEEVYATDKYGHYIYMDSAGRYNTDDDYDAATGEKVIITQPKVLISNSAVFSQTDYIDCTAETDTDNSRQYKATYRVQIGELKAECTVIYIKNRAGSDIDVSGKTKIEFVYGEDV